MQAGRLLCGHGRQGQRGGVADIWQEIFCIPLWCRLRDGTARFVRLYHHGYKPDQYGRSPFPAREGRYQTRCGHMDGQLSGVAGQVFPDLAFLREDAFLRLFPVAVRENARHSLSGRGGFLEFRLQPRLSRAGALLVLGAQDRGGEHRPDECIAIA